MTQEVIGQRHLGSINANQWIHGLFCMAGTNLWNTSRGLQTS